MYRRQLWWSVEFQVPCGIFFVDRGSLKETGVMCMTFLGSRRGLLEYCVPREGVGRVVQGEHILSSRGCRDSVGCPGSRR
jgi:hypothetical protein